MTREYWRSIPIDRFREASGALAVMECGKHLPFEVRRVFWVSEVAGPDTRRGAHAHEDLQQVLFASKGSCMIDLETPGGKTQTIALTEQGDALYLQGPVWRTMHNFSPDCSLMVLCDREYSQDRVVRDYEEFKRLG